MARNGVPEIFDVEGAFEAGREEAAKGGDEGGEGCHGEDVELHGGDAESRGEEGPGGGDEGQGVALWDEDRVGGAVEACPDVGAEVVDGTGEVGAAHEDVGEEEAH